MIRIELLYIAIAFIVASLLSAYSLRFMGLVMAAMVIVYFAVEFGWGGGDPNHKDHNRPPWYL